MNMNVIYEALMFVVTMSSGNASAQQLPYQNPALSAHERAVDLCGRLTLEEKASLMLDDSPAIPRLGIKRFQWWSEALHGVANMGDVTVFRSLSEWQLRLTTEWCIESLMQHLMRCVPNGMNCSRREEM